MTVLFKPIFLHYILIVQVVEIIGGGGAKRYVCPPPNIIIRGAAAPPPPPLPQDRCLWPQGPYEKLYSLYLTPPACINTVHVPV